MDYEKGAMTHYVYHQEKTGRVGRPAYCPLQEKGIKRGNFTGIEGQRKV